MPFEKELRSYKAPGKLYRARQTVPVSFTNIFSRATKAAASQEPFSFYKSALQQAARDELRASKEEPGLWEDVILDDKDHDKVRLENENERLERYEDPQYYDKVLQHTEDDDEKHTTVALRELLCKDWPYFRTYWNGIIAKFWSKVEDLNGATLTDGHRLLFKLLDLKLVQYLKPGFRPYIKQSKHSRGVIFNFKRSEFKKGCTSIPRSTFSLPGYVIQHSAKCACFSRKFGLTRKRQMHIMHQKENVCAADDTERK